mmetsp:Transcript_49777/g.118595  ORF Transcript_49777/g.118595 Transcript_49777/m.118595 type:complete len:364 (+) Transcript_49777:3653-4744(+)
MVRLARDASMPVPLVPAVRARAPLGPLAPETIHAGHVASLCVARLHLLCGILTRRAVIGSRNEDVARTLPLAGVTTRGAALPFLPVAHLARPCRIWLAVRRHRLAGSRRARLHELQGLFQARLAIAACILLHRPMALAHAEALAAAAGPGAPSGKYTVLVGHAVRLVLANLVLVLEAYRWTTAVVGVPVHAAVTRLVGCGACGRTSGPRAPRAPPAIHAHLAALRRAGGDLPLLLRVASPAAVPGRLLDDAVPAHGAPAAGAAASAPFVPVSPHAVQSHAILHPAWPDLLQSFIAAGVRGAFQDFAAARVDPVAAALAAAGPLCPHGEAAHRCFAPWGAACLNLLHRYTLSNHCGVEEAARLV